MSDRFAAQTVDRYPSRDRGFSAYGGAKADDILARAERRGKSSSVAAPFENASFDNMDKLAAVVAAIMTIGPLFAAFVGRMHP